MYERSGEYSRHCGWDTPNKALHRCFSIFRGEQKHGFLQKRKIPCSFLSTLQSTNFRPNPCGQNDDLRPHRHFWGEFSEIRPRNLANPTSWRPWASQTRPPKANAGGVCALGAATAVAHPNIQVRLRRYGKGVRWRVTIDYRLSDALGETTNQPKIYSS